jgi:hypothetical protein
MKVSMSFLTSRRGYNCLVGVGVGPGGRKKTNVNATLPFRDKLDHMQEQLFPLRRSKSFGQVKTHSHC